jgi:hypothetical protein
MAASAAVYRPRNPQSSDYYRCVEDYFETFIGIYDEYFSRQYGFWRPYIEQVIYRYLDYGNLHNGFALLKKLVTNGNHHFNPKSKTTDLSVNTICQRRLISILFKSKVRINRMNQKRDAASTAGHDKQFRNRP